MSELKARRIGQLMSETGRCDTEVYLKSEADKVIAELKETLNNSRNARKYWRKEYLIEYKESIHHKYKRCLAMAKWCRTSARCDEGLGAFKYRDWYWKWFKRWMKLAEQFKEAK